jgi:SRSO17 transposase
MLIFDETGFQKKLDSVGVAKQYCGSLGKVENCQMGFLRRMRRGMAIPFGQAPVHAREKVH